ncbi:MAG: DUF3135 domain-containing protein [Oceanospirillaceae bacterium]
MYSLPSFDHLKELNDTAPEAFEALRAELVSNCIKSVPKDRRYRLQGLQFHIDARRPLAKTPMESCINISKMMHENFWKLHESIDELSSCYVDINSEISAPAIGNNLHLTPSHNKDPVLTNKQTADIIEFSKSR